MAFALFSISSTSLSLPLSPSALFLSYFDVPWIIKVVLRSPSRKWYIPKQDCYLLCFGRLGCFLYERKNFGISNACRLPVKSVKSCGRSIIELWQITSFREEGSGKPAHNLSTIILHQLCSKGTQLTTEQAQSLKMMLWCFKTVWERVYYLRKEFDLFMVRIAKKTLARNCKEYILNCVGGTSFSLTDPVLLWAQQ